MSDTEQLPEIESVDQPAPEAEQKSRRAFLLGALAGAAGAATMVPKAAQAQGRRAKPKAAQQQNSGADPFATGALANAVAAPTEWSNATTRLLRRATLRRARSDAQRMLTPRSAFSQSNEEGHFLVRREVAGSRQTLPARQYRHGILEWRFGFSVA